MCDEQAGDGLARCARVAALRQMTKRLDNEMHTTSSALTAYQACVTAVTPLLAGQSPVSALHAKECQLMRDGAARLRSSPDFLST